MASARGDRLDSVRERHCQIEIDGSRSCDAIDSFDDNEVLEPADGWKRYCFPGGAMVCAARDWHQVGNIRSGIDCEDGIEGGADGVHGE